MLCLVISVNIYFLIVFKLSLVNFFLHCLYIVCYVIFHVVKFVELLTIWFLLKIPQNRYVFRRNIQNPNFQLNNKARSLSNVARDSRVNNMFHNKTCKYVMFWWVLTSNLFIFGWIGLSVDHSDLLSTASKSNAKSFFFLKIKLNSLRTSISFTQYKII